MQVAHSKQSPLLLCDTCPRAFHQACLGLSAGDLPLGDWSCPKCVGGTQSALRRVMESEGRRQVAGERAAARVQEKAAKRAFRNGRDRRMVGGVWGMCCLRSHPAKCMCAKG